jgi:prevent-host-death family protein
MASHRIVNVHDAKTHLSKLLSEVAQGAEIVIARAGEPVARLVPMQLASREFGSAAELIDVPEDFDETPTEILDDFYR